MTNAQQFEPLYNLKHACTHLPNGTNQRRSEVLEGRGLELFESALLAMSRLASHYGFHELKTSRHG